MVEALSSVKWSAVLAASVLLAVLGAAWFMGPFAKPYAAALGRDDLGKQKPGPLFIAGPFVCGIVVTVTNALLLHALGITSYASALAFGAFIGFGYLVATTVNVAINPNMSRPLLYGLVSGGYFFVGNVLNCAVLTALS